MKILIIGANSAIARACARIYANQHAELYLLGRDQLRLDELVADLGIRGAASVAGTVVDLADCESHEAALQKACAALGEIDVALIAHGTLPDQVACEEDFAAAEFALRVNGSSVISLLTLLAAQMKQQHHGTLAVITSVAGDRGRQPNFVYGAAKAMVSTYLQGLRGRLFEHNIHIVDIKPGLVDSPMTAHMDKGMLFSSPERVASKIVRSIARRKHTVYAPGYWHIILWVVRAIPDFIFKRVRF